MRVKVRAMFQRRLLQVLYEMPCQKTREAGSILHIHCQIASCIFVVRQSSSTQRFDPSIMATGVEELQFAPEKGNVVFASAVHGRDC